MLLTMATGKAKELFWCQKIIMNRTFQWWQSTIWNQLHPNKCMAIFLCIRVFIWISFIKWLFWVCRIIRKKYQWIASEIVKRSCGMHPHWGSSIESSGFQVSDIILFYKGRVSRGQKRRGVRAFWTNFTSHLNTVANYAKNNIFLLL